VQASAQRKKPVEVSPTKHSAELHNTAATLGKQRREGVLDIGALKTTKLLPPMDVTVEKSAHAVASLSSNRSTSTAHILPGDEATKQTSVSLDVSLDGLER